MSKNGGGSTKRKYQVELQCECVKDRYRVRKEGPGVTASEQEEVF